MRKVTRHAAVLSAVFLVALNCYGEEFKRHAGQAQYSIATPDDWSYTPGGGSGLWDQLASPNGRIKITIAVSESSASRTAEQIFEQEVLPEFSSSGKGYTIRETNAETIDGQDALDVVVRIRETGVPTPGYLEKLYVISGAANHWYLLQYRAESDESFQENLRLVDMIANSFRCIPPEQALKDKASAEAGI